MLVGAATIAVMAGGTLRLPLVFVTATLAGVRLHGFGIDLLLVELAMALSVFGCGLVLLLGRARPRATLAACFAAAGVAHGCAYAEHTATTTAATFLAALLGLVVVQVAAVTAVYYAGRGVAARGAGAASGLFEATGNYVVMAGTIALLLAAV
jgi:urease accessory protein